MAKEMHFIELLEGERSDAHKNLEFFINSSPARQISNTSFPYEEWKLHRVARQNKKGYLEYSVSNYGRIRSVYSGKFLKYTLNRDRITKDLIPMRYEKTILGGPINSTSVEDVFRAYFPEYCYDTDDMFALEGEEWREITFGYKNPYYISNYGRVKTMRRGGLGWHYLAKDRLLEDGSAKFSSTYCLYQSNGRKPRIAVHKLLSEHFPEAIIESMKSALKDFNRYEDEFWLKTSEDNSTWVSSYGREACFYIMDYTKIFTRYTIEQLGPIKSRRVLRAHKDQIIHNEMYRIETVIEMLIEEAYQIASKRTPRMVRLERKRSATDRNYGKFEIYDRRTKGSRFYQALDELASAEGIPENVAADLVRGVRLEYRSLKIYFRGKRVKS